MKSAVQTSPKSVHQVKREEKLHEARQPFFVGSGIECNVYEFGPKLVLKTYRSEGERERAHDRQKRACVLGIAPPTRGLMNYGRRFGYLSCVAQMELQLPWSKRIIYRPRLIARLKKIMRNMGLSVGDLHEGNIGRYKGKACAIDFGDKSVAYCNV